MCDRMLQDSLRCYRDPGPGRGVGWGFEPGAGWSGDSGPRVRGVVGIQARRGVEWGFGPRRGVGWGFGPWRGVEWGFGPERGVGWGFLG